MNFDTIINRNGTNCEKWDSMKKLYGSDDLLPMWVADSDFACPEVVSKAIEERAKHPIYGYSFPSDSLYEAIMEKMERDHGWKINKEWILFSDGVIDGLNTAVNALSIPGDNIIVQPPVYHNFFTVINNAGRRVNANPLRFTDKYVMDYEDLDKRFDPRTRAFMLCSPHNPVGRVWTEAELAKAAEICIKHRAIFLSDEIHADIVFAPHKHIVSAAISSEIRKHTISFIAASKTFNIPGLATSIVIIPDDELRQHYLCAQRKHYGGNLFGYIATEAAFRHGMEYRDNMVDYVKGNMDMFLEYVNERIPQIKIIQPEGCYVLWADMREIVGIEENDPKAASKAAELDKIIREKCKLALNSGGMFGNGGLGFQRFNLACPRVYVKEALRRLSKGLER